jgi:hypothetical protein
MTEDNCWLNTQQFERGMALTHLIQFQLPSNQQCLKKMADTQETTHAWPADSTIGGLGRTDGETFGTEALSTRNPSAWTSKEKALIPYRMTPHDTSELLQAWFTDSFYY